LFLFYLLHSTVNSYKMPLKNDDERYPNDTEHSSEQESVIESERRRALEESRTQKTGEVICNAIFSIIFFPSILSCLGCVVCFGILLSYAGNAATLIQEIPFFSNVTCTVIGTDLQCFYSPYCLLTVNYNISQFGPVNCSFVGSSQYQVGDVETCFYYVNDPYICSFWNRTASYDSQVHGTIVTAILTGVFGILPAILCFSICIVGFLRDPYTKLPISPMRPNFSPTTSSTVYGDRSSLETSPMGSTAAAAATTTTTTTTTGALNDNNSSASVRQHPDDVIGRMGGSPSHFVTPVNAMTGGHNNDPAHDIIFLGELKQQQLPPSLIPTPPALQEFSNYDYSATSTAAAAAAATGGSHSQQIQEVQGEQQEFTSVQL